MVLSSKNKLLSNGKRKAANDIKGTSSIGLIMKYLKEHTSISLEYLDANLITNLTLEDVYSHYQVTRQNDSTTQEDKETALSNGQRKLENHAENLDRSMPD